jgi:hypothetical protein
MASSKIDTLKGVLVHPSKILLDLEPGVTLNASKLRMCTRRIINGHFFSSCLPEQVLKNIKAG